MSTSSETSFNVIESSFVDNDKMTPFSGSIDKVLQYMYENGLYTDVSFHVRCGDGYVNFSCHKLVLRLWSPIFAKTFCQEESNEVTIEISEMPPSAFEVMIKYCYGIETQLQKYRNDVNFLLKLYRGATKYKINGLKLMCCEFFSCTLPTKDNVFELLDAATILHSDALMHRCYKVIKRQTREIVESRELSDISQSDINIILGMETLSLDSEYDLISWVFNWASCQKDGIFKDTMAPFLPRFNFLSLTPEEFGSLVQKYQDFFDEKEGFAIFMNIVCPGSRPLPPWFGKKFDRCFIKAENASI